MKATKVLSASQKTDEKLFQSQQSISCGKEMEQNDLSGREIL